MRWVACLSSIVFAARADEPKPGAEPGPTPPVSVADQAIYAALARVLPEVVFEAAPLDRTLAWFTEQLKVNTHVDWRSLEDLGLDAQWPVSLRVRNVSIERALRLALDEAGSSEVRLCFEPRDAVLLIGTCEQLGYHLVARVYPVADLIAVALDYPPQDATPAGGGAVPLARAADPQFRERLARHAVEMGRRRSDRLAGQEDEVSQSLITLVVDTIEPDSWAQNGGLGTIHYYRGSFVVRNSAAVHRALQALLDDLRAAERVNSVAITTLGVQVAP